MTDFKKYHQWICIIFLLFSCSSKPQKLAFDFPQHKIQLKWNKSYPDDSIEKAVIGLQWAFSHLGANNLTTLSEINPKDSIIVLHVDQLGFGKKALQKLEEIHQIIFKTEEYAKNTNIDLGRYVTLLLGSAEHYFELIGVPENLDDILKNYTLLPEKAYVNNSTISFEHRIIQYSEQNGLNQLFFCKEIDSMNREVLEYETIEILPNGNLRFGIFDKNGKRKLSANKTHSDAGKPAKCIWCHESNIQRMYARQNDVQGFLTAEDFQKKLIYYSADLRKKQTNLTDGVDFGETYNHTFTELIYISFMEPNAERLSREWQLPLNVVKKKLAHLPTHYHEEFKFLGELYHRHAVEKFAPFKSIMVSGNVREITFFEVNYLK